MTVMAEQLSPVTLAEATRAHWVLIRTEPRKELAVYSALLDLVTDAWLPREPRFTRLARSRNHRQWWAPVLPGYLFAAGVALADVATLRYFKHIEADCDGKPLDVPEAVIMRFRRMIDDENREALRVLRRSDQAGKIADRLAVKRTQSRRLKPRKAAAALRAEVYSRLTRHNG